MASIPILEEEEGAAELLRTGPSLILDVGSAPGVGRSPVVSSVTRKTIATDVDAVAAQIWNIRSGLGGQI